MSNLIDVVRMLHISAIDQLALKDDLFNVSLKMIFFPHLTSNLHLLLLMWLVISHHIHNYRF